MNQNDGIQMTPKSEEKEDYLTLTKKQNNRRLSKQPYYQNIDSDEESMLFGSELNERVEPFKQDITASILRPPTINDDQEEEMIKFIRLTIAGFSLLIFWCFGRYSDSVNWVMKIFITIPLLFFCKNEIFWIFYCFDAINWTAVSPLLSCLHYL